MLSWSYESLGAGDRELTLPACSDVSGLARMIGTKEIEK
jgi:hypothetical protein